MAKERSENKDKKEKKEKRKSVDGVTKDKKSKKDRKSTDATTEVIEAEAVEDETLVDADGDVVVDGDAAAVAKVPLGALVPFANPLCDEKAGKKVLKSVKKAAKQKALKRGVKEVVKAVRKSPIAAPTASSSQLPPGIVVIAADISPMDVISHIPVLCEDHSIPYVFVPSRAELGAAGSTKRPTSVVMVVPKSGAKAGEGGEDAAAWEETFKEMNKLVVKQGQHVKV